jgi:hypothetical protein
MADQAPLPFLTTWPSVGRCVLASGRVHQPRTRVGQGLRFADGSAARAYRETVGSAPPVLPRARTGRPWAQLRRFSRATQGQGFEP